MQLESYFLNEAEKEILDKINRKGWNIYNSTNTKQKGAEAVIMDGPIKKLEIGERYVLMPISENPKDPEKVFRALEIYALKNNREIPTILIGFKRYPWTGFIPNKTNIKVNTIIGHHVLYREFVIALDSIVEAN